MKQRMLWAQMVVVAGALLAGGCGSDSPTASDASGVVVEGGVMGGAASVSAADVQTSSAAAKKLTVKVEGTTLTVDVSANGTFKLEGVPSGTFTLVFLQDGVEIGRVVVTAGDDMEVKIVVQVTGATIVVVELKVEGRDVDKPTPSSGSSCGVNGASLGQGIELEGDVSSGNSSTFKLSVNGRASFPIDVNAASASYRCVGQAKASSDAECKANVKAGAKVHVSGSLASCTAASATVTASEVMVQKG